MEAVLAILLAVASAIGAIFWRKTVSLRTAAHDQVDELRKKARDDNALREKTVQANLDHFEEEMTQVSDDKDGRQKLADFLNRTSLD